MSQHTNPNLLYTEKNQKYFSKKCQPKNKKKTAPKAAPTSLAKNSHSHWESLACVCVVAGVTSDVR